MGDIVGRIEPRSFSAFSLLREGLADMFGMIGALTDGPRKPLGG
jgi:hypothetical protein